MPDPLAFFLTWTTYGTWLPGDERGWVKKGEGFQPPQPQLQAWAKQRMTEEACFLDDEQREFVEKTICDHCAIRKWELFAVSCRTNHVHVVVAAYRDPDDVRDQFKAWCTRKLKELAIMRGVEDGKVRSKWWTEKGSQRFIGDEESLEAVILYVKEGQ
jgi:REP element-mobilizing transposase RayT